MNRGTWMPKKTRSYQWKDREFCKCGNPKARRDQRVCGTCARQARESKELNPN